MPHLLIVDDEPAIRELIAEIAIEDGYTVAQAGDVRQARIQIERQKPDVALLDVQLPDGDGIQFWKDLALVDTQVVFITRYSSVDSAIAALRCGAVAYLLQPVSLRRLHGVLGELKSLSPQQPRSEEHTSDLKSIMRPPYAVLCLKQKTTTSLSTTNHVS